MSGKKLYSGNVIGVSWQKTRDRWSFTKQNKTKPKQNKEINKHKTQNKTQNERFSTS